MKNGKEAINYNGKQYYKITDEEPHNNSYFPRYDWLVSDIDGNVFELYYDLPENFENFEDISMVLDFDKPDEIINKNYNYLI